MDDKIYVNKQTGQIVPEGYPNSEAYVKLSVARLAVSAGVDPDYQINKKQIHKKQKS